MTTQAITDFLTKRLFIERNIVTYRSLSRQFSIHVNVAKNELATFHHNAQYQSQACRATFLLNGIPRAPAYDEDYDMEGTQNATQEEEEGGDEVPQMQITIVNEAELEDAKASYEELTSLHVYSLSPAPIHDAGLLCAPTEFVRNTDREKGPAFSISLGRIVAKGIKMGASKTKARPSAPVAGPSKLKQSEPKAPVKVEPPKETTNAATDKGKEKPKPTGKLTFFSKPKEPAAKPVKTEDTDSKKKLFFSRPAAPAKVAAEPLAPKVKETVKPASKEVESTKELPQTKIDKPEPARGVKRKSSVGLEPREKSPESVPPTSKPPPAAPDETHRFKRRVVLSDDEDSEPIVSRPPARKARPSFKTESTENSDAEREARALMDIDDDQVEKVSRVPSTNASSNEFDEDDGGDASPGIQDEDVSMDEDAPKAKAKRGPRKPKIVIPVGRNGLKKKKVTKTRRMKDANGYTVKVDYSDWESVEEGDEVEPPKPAVKAKVVKVKKEESAEIEGTPPPAKEKAKKKEPAPAKKPAVKAAPKPKPPVKGAASAKGKSQQTLNFFGPKKT